MKNKKEKKESRETLLDGEIKREGEREKEKCGGRGEEGEAHEVERTPHQ